MEENKLSKINWLIILVYLNTFKVNFKRQISTYIKKHKNFGDFKLCKSEVECNYYPYYPIVDVIKQIK